MPGVFEYLHHHGNDGMAERPFAPPDALVLCEMTYTKWDGIVPSLFERAEPVGMRQLGSVPLPRSIFKSLMDMGNNEKLFRTAAASRRFADMQLADYVDEVDAAAEKQFSALTYRLGDGTSFVAFRGTDETIVGWKEDFNMAFLSPVPAQEQAVAYLNAVGRSLPGRLRVGGHSKGGNLAVYAAMRCDPAVRDRIVDVWSLDGPGFRRDALARREYEGIRRRVRRYLPQSSVIGMLLLDQEEYRVVASRQIGLLQHDLFSWQTAGTDFRYREDVTERSAGLSLSIAEWLDGLDDAQRRKFIDGLFHIIQATEAKTIYDFLGNRRERRERFFGAIAETDPETRRFLGKTLRSLFETASNDARRRRKEKIAARRAALIERRKAAKHKGPA
jgi:hypothetical protein